MTEKITKYPSSVLRRRAGEVSLDDETRTLIKRMKKAVKKHDGIGLAAPQIGESKKVIVIETGDSFTALLNPEILEKSEEKITTKEGCLSVDGVWLDIERAKKVKARALTEEGEEVEIEAEDLLAVVLQHEIDHLNGILFIDRAGFQKKMKSVILYYFKNIFMSSKNLADLLKEKGHLESERIYDAFCKIDRKDFVLPDVQEYAYEDAPLSIGSGQTISQPSVVAFMIEKLDPQKNDKVLDIGCGSGWTTALLAELTKEVIAIEIIPELKCFGEENVSRYGFIEEGRVKVFCENGYKGLLEEAPYDKILVSAALPEMGEVPFIWNEQLNEGGVIVVPVKNSIYKLTKKNGEFIQEEYSGFSFVPLVNSNKDEE